MKSACSTSNRAAIPSRPARGDGRRRRLVAISVTRYAKLIFYRNEKTAGVFQPPDSVFQPPDSVFQPPDFLRLKQY